MSTIKVVTFKVGQNPTIEEIDDKLESLQEFVGGYIQCVPVNRFTLICNEEGALNKLPYQESYGMFGNFLITNSDYSTGELVSLTDDASQYIKDNISDLLEEVLRW